MINFTTRMGALAVAGAIAIAAPIAQAAPITFAPGDYDNNTVQTFGYFRDIHNGQLINSGLDLGGAPSMGCAASSCSNPGTNTALNFTGSDNNASPRGRVTVYDTTPVDGAVKSTFTGNMTMSADILTSRFNNAKGAGLVTMFNEGAGNTGIALFLQNAGNSDALSIKLEMQDGVDVANLGSASLGGGIMEDSWYRLVLSLVFTGADFTVTGTVYSHTTANDPNSALGAPIGTLVYTDVSPWTGGLSTPYEIGLVARGVSAVVDTSVTNFDFSGGGTDAPVPEPGTMALLALGLAGLAAMRRKVGM